MAPVRHTSESVTLGHIDRTPAAVIRPGAFAASLATDDVRALFNHDPNVILGRNRAGTLLLTEDERGLKIEIDPPDTQSARDLTISIARGDITQMSFGFAVNPDGQIWEKDSDGKVLRTRTSVRLAAAFPRAQRPENSLCAWSNLACFIGCQLASSFAEPLRFALAARAVF